MLQFVVITATVTNFQANLAVRIVCAEKPVITAPSIPIVALAKSAVMAEIARRFVFQVTPQVRTVRLEPALPVL